MELALPIVEGVTRPVSKSAAADNMSVAKEEFALLFSDFIRCHCHSLWRFASSVCGGRVASFMMVPAWWIDCIYQMLVHWIKDPKHPFTWPRAESPFHVGALASTGGCRLLERCCQGDGVRVDDESAFILRNVRVLGPVSEPTAIHQGGDGQALPMYDGAKVFLDHPENPTKGDPSRILWACCPGRSRMTMACQQT